MFGRARQSVAVESQQQRQVSAETSMAANIAANRRPYNQVGTRPRLRRTFPSYFSQSAFCGSVMPGVVTALAAFSISSRNFLSLAWNSSMIR